jgi:hypothetical protein
VKVTTSSGTFVERFQMHSQAVMLRTSRCTTDADAAVLDKAFLKLNSARQHGQVVLDLNEHA